MPKDDNPLLWPDERHLTRDEAAAYARTLGFRLAPRTLAKYACGGAGPLITYFGSKPYYQLADLRSWLLGRTRRSRSTVRPFKLQEPTATGEQEPADAKGGLDDED